MDRAQRLTAASFEPNLGSEFRLDGEVGPIVLRLTAVDPLGRQPQAPRADPFRVEFLGPADPVLPQRIYRVEHPSMGALDLFLVPLGPDRRGGILYEAIFN